jgi:hypothetical protein
MPLNALPTKTDDSIGRVKSDSRALTNINTQVPAAELERLKTAILDIASEVGIHDQDGPFSSLNARVLALEEADLVDSLQEAYEGGAVISVAAGTGFVGIENATDATDCLVIDRSFAGTGRALRAVMGAGTTDVGIQVEALGSGPAIRITSGDNTRVGLTPNALIFRSDIINGFSIYGEPDPDPGVVGTNLNLSGGAGSVGPGGSGAGGDIRLVGGTGAVTGGGGSGAGGSVVIGGGAAADLGAAGGHVFISAGDGTVKGNVRIGVSDTAELQLGHDGVDYGPDTAYLGANGLVVVDSNDAGATAGMEFRIQSIARLAVRDALIECTAGLDVDIASSQNVLFTIDGTDVFKAQDDGVRTISIRPKDDDAWQLGSSGFRWIECHAEFGYFTSFTIGDENEAGGVNFEKKQVQTLNDVPVALATLPLLDSHVYWLEAKVVARQAGGSNRAFYIRQVRAHREGAGAVLGTIQTPVTDESAAGWNVTFMDTGGGNDIVLAVIGAAATTIDWKCLLTWQAVG